ncbi:polysaccharide deacetylase family protein [Paenibacillus residui]|uniref:Polysaccharide deacetylase family protein n=1 Tax=Paenibacillus residui TaxID=629724 RepID=A0ABW3D5B6_9BACL
MKRRHLYLIALSLLLIVVYGCGIGREKDNSSQPFGPDTTDSLLSKVEQNSERTQEQAVLPKLPAASPVPEKQADPAPPATEPPKPSTGGKENRSPAEPKASPSVREQPPVPAAQAPQPSEPDKHKEKAKLSKPKPLPKQSGEVAAGKKTTRQSSGTSSQLTLSELRAKYPDSFRLKGSSKGKKVALTFDDGPDQRFTPQVLDVLKKYNVKATFFLVGYRAEANPAVVKRIAKEGHVIGNHSYNHPNFPKLPVTVFEQQINRTQNILSRLIGYEPKYIRPPYGAINEEQLQWAIKNQFLIVNWDVDSLDWKGLDAKQVSANILNHAHAGAIILQHSAGGDGQNLSGTIEALPGIIEKLQADGYELVTIPQLLNMSKSK